MPRSSWHHSPAYLGTGVHLQHLKSLLHLRPAVPVLATAWRQPQFQTEPGMLPASQGLAAELGRLTGLVGVYEGLGRAERHALAPALYDHWSVFATCQSRANMSIRHRQACNHAIVSAIVLKDLIKHQDRLTQVGGTRQRGAKKPYPLLPILQVCLICPLVCQEAHGRMSTTSYRDSETACMACVKWVCTTPALHIAVSNNPAHACASDKAPEESWAAA